MGRVLTYIIEEEPAKALIGLRLRGLDHHVVFDGNESEGEFHKHYPDTNLELRGLYSFDDGMLSVMLTDVPKEVQHHEVEGMFEKILGPHGTL